MKINYHSFVDVITNSSTTIYTYQSGSVPAIKEVLNEMLKLLGEELTTDDLFHIGSFCDTNSYLDRFGDDEDEDVKDPFEGLDYKERGAAIKVLLNEILIGKKEKPEWMKDAEGKENRNGLNPDMYLHVVPKDDKYKDLAEKLVKFLNSSSHDGCYNG